jgi:hypothetical protein
VDIYNLDKVASYVVEYQRAVYWESCTYLYRYGGGGVVVRRKGGQRDVEKYLTP